MCLMVLVGLFVLGILANMTVNVINVAVFAADTHTPRMRLPSMVLVRANLPGNKITVFRETTKVQI